VMVENSEEREERGDEMGRSEGGGQGEMHGALPLSPRVHCFVGGCRRVACSPARASAATGEPTREGEGEMGLGGLASRHCALRPVHSGLSPFSIFCFSFLFCFGLFSPLLLICKI
jgi:hypothetical protein